MVMRRHSLSNLTRGRAATKAAVEKLVGKKRQYPEQQISAQFSAWINLCYPDLLCTSSLVGVKLPVWIAARAKKSGVRKGWPDWFFAESRGGHHGLFIELKSAEGRTEPEQKALHEKLRAKRYKVVVTKGLEAAKMALEEYLHG